MTYRFAKLLSFAVDHGYYAGTALSFLAWKPTVRCAAALTQRRLLYRSQRNGGVVLYEVDTTRSGSVPLIPLADDLVLTFVAQEVDPVFTGATEPPPSPGSAFYFSNRAGVLESAVGRLHEGTYAAAADQVRLVPPTTILRFTGVTQDQSLQIRDTDGTVVVGKKVAPAEGVIETAVDLGSWAPGLFEIRLGTTANARIYADADLPAQHPTAILELVLRPQGNGGFAILEAPGIPVEGGRALRMSCQTRATIWRYVVVPRTNPDLDPGDLRVQHVPESGLPFTFSVAGTKPVPSATVEAMVFESTTPISLRALPHRGLTLQYRSDHDAEFVTTLTDLPNPRPDVLSLGSTPGRPISEVFLYL